MAKFIFEINEQTKFTYIRPKIDRHKLGADFLSETMGNPTNDAFFNSILLRCGEKFVFFSICFLFKLMSLVVVGTWYF